MQAIFSVQNSNDASQKIHGPGRIRIIRPELLEESDTDNDKEIDDIHSVNEMGAPLDKNLIIEEILKFLDSPWVEEREIRTEDVDQLQVPNSLY